MCDDIAATKAELEGRGAVFLGDIRDMGFGLAIELDLPGAGPILVYEPRHPGRRSTCSRGATARDQMRTGGALSTAGSFSGRNGCS